VPPFPAAARGTGGTRAEAPQPGLASAVGALSKLTGAVRGRRARGKPRLAMSAIFADLVDMADISRSAYAVDEEVTGAMCLFKTEDGYEVFSCAEALRNGRLGPRRS
jgi:hypothetical protein